MYILCKIFPLLLLISALSLSSCVNEAKKTPVVESTPIDTNYLHRFTKVKISFYGTLQYFDTSTDYSGKFNNSLGQYTKRITLGVQSNFSDFYISLGTSERDFLITWKGNLFYINGYAYHDTSYSWNGNPYTEVGISSNERFLFYGGISQSGNQIDSLHGSYTGGVDFINMHYKENDNAKQSLELKQLPNFLQSSDTLAFSATGNQLESMINVFHDRSSQVYNEQLRLHELKNILWDASVAPVLTVTFFR